MLNTICLSKEDHTSQLFKTATELKLCTSLMVMDHIALAAMNNLAVKVLMIHVRLFHLWCPSFSSMSINNAEFNKDRKMNIVGGGHVVESKTGSILWILVV